MTALKNVTSNIALDAAKKLIIQDSFGDAFIFARDRGGHDLGLPIGDAEIVKLYPNPSVTTEWIDVIVQEFENGKIMQEVYDNAAPIYGNMHTIWARRRRYTWWRRLCRFRYPQQVESSHTKVLHIKTLSMVT